MTYPEGHQPLQSSTKQVEADEDVPNSKSTNKHEKTGSLQKQDAIHELNRIRTMVTGVVAKMSEKKRGIYEDGKGTEPFNSEGVTESGSLIKNYEATISRLETDLGTHRNENSTLKEKNAQMLLQLASRERKLRALRVNDAVDEKTLESAIVNGFDVEEEENLIKAVCYVD